mgnify:CR=1 FL=1
MSSDKSTCRTKDYRSGDTSVNVIEVRGVLATTVIGRLATTVRGVVATTERGLLAIILLEYEVY